jgi:lactocepin
VRRIARVVVAAVLLVACGDGSSRADDESAPREGVRRVLGNDAYEVAAALATEKYSSTSDPILASGEDPADALAGSFLGGLHASPVLLTQRDELPRVTLDALRSIGARTVHVLGGTASVSDAVVAALTDNGFTPNRIAGVDRFATAAAAAT